MFIIVVALFRDLLLEGHESGHVISTDFNFLKIGIVSIAGSILTIHCDNMIFTHAFCILMPV